MQLSWITTNGSSQYLTTSVASAAQVGVVCIVVGYEALRDNHLA
jgi:hypothetical protein